MTRATPVYAPRIAALSAALLICGASVAQAAIPEVLNVQGVIRDAIGDPVDGTFAVTFALFDAESGGNELWSETQADVPVDVGVFSALLGNDGGNPLPASDFATAAELWIEVQVGSETPLPRQRLVASAYAFEANHALSADAAGALACTGCVGSAALDFDPATQSELDDFAAAPLVSYACSVGEALAFDGAAWQCTPFPEGDITAVSTAVGSGLMGGGSTGALSLAIASGGVTSAMIANGTVTSLDISNGTISDVDIAADAAIAQSKIAGTIGDITGVTATAGGGLTGGAESGDVSLALQSCGAGQTLIQAASGWRCGVPGPPPVQVPSATELHTVYDSGSVGMSSCISIGADGLPVIGFFDLTNHKVLVAKCGDAACSANNTVSTLDAGTFCGSELSLAVGVDGYPVVSYFDSPATNLMVAKCADAACAAGTTLTTVDSTGYVGSTSSIAVGSDQLPIVSYYDFSNGALKVTHCGDAACTSGNTTTTVSATNDAGKPSVIAIGLDGLPVIAHRSDTDDRLRFVKCGNAACSAGNAEYTVDASGTVGGWLDLDIGADGLPLMAYLDATNLNLKVAWCGTADCSGGITLTTLDSAGDVGYFASLTVPPDGLPIVAYNDATNDDVRIVKCRNLSCSALSATVVVDSAGVVGVDTSITVGVDGLPILSYQDVSNGDLKVAKCANPYCLAYWSRR